MATKKPITQVNTYDEELMKAAETAAAQHTAAAGVQNQISLRGATINVGGTIVPGGQLSCIIMDDVPLNQFFRGAFNPTNPEGPVCFAFGDPDDPDTPLVPHHSCVQKQSVACAGCPKNEFGSAIRDGKPAPGKACNNTQRLVAIVATNLQTGKPLSPAELKNAPVWQLGLSPTNIRNWAQYVVNLRHATNRPPFGVVSVLRVTPDPRKQINCEWALARPLTNDEYGAIRDRRQEARDLMMVPFTTVLRGENPATPQGTPGKTKKKYV